MSQKQNVSKTGWKTWAITLGVTLLGGIILLIIEAVTPKEISEMVMGFNTLYLLVGFIVSCVLLARSDLVSLWTILVQIGALVVIGGIFFIELVLLVT
jgi:hypothetical protein